MRNFFPVTSFNFQKTFHRRIVDFTFMDESGPKTLTGEYSSGTFSNFFLYFKLVWILRIRQGASYFLLTYLVPLIFVLLAFMSGTFSTTDIKEVRIPTPQDSYDPAIILPMISTPILLAPDTPYLRSHFTNITTTPTLFMNSKTDVADNLVGDYEKGLGLVLSGSAPTVGSPWSLMVITQPMGGSALSWVDAVRVIGDRILNFPLTWASQGYARPASVSTADQGAALGYWFALAFVTVGLIKGLMLTIVLKETRIAFLLTLNGVSEFCQATVSWLSSLVESLLTLVVSIIIFKFGKPFNASDVTYLAVSYVVAAVSWLFFSSGLITLLSSQKGFGLFVAIGVILATAIWIISDFGDYFPPAILLIIETIFPFGNFMGVIAHAVTYSGIKTGNLSLTYSGISGLAQFICVFVNLLINFVLCLILNFCKAPPFGLPPIGWSRLFKLAAWRALFKRSELVEFTRVDIENVTKVYNKKITAVSDVSFSIEKGECILCVGANGAGKSTLLEMLSGAREPTEGTVSACGSDIFVDTRSYHTVLSIVFQDNSLIPTYTAREHIEFFARLNGKGDAEIKDLVHLFASMFKMKPFLDNTSENLSGGSKRKLCLAIALVKDPQVLVCDEPCAGIDVEARQTIWRAISSYPQMTSFINVHSIDEAESMTSRILVMSQGKVRFLGSPAEMREAFECGYEIAVLDETPMEQILANVAEVVPEVKLSPDHDRTLMLPADLRVGAALQAMGDANYVVQLDSIEITIRKMIEDDEALAVGHA
jgi:ABC-type multidrug transport system ATPase subunit